MSAPIIDEMHHLLDYAERDRRWPQRFRLGFKQIGEFFAAFPIPPELRRDVSAKGWRFEDVAIDLVGEEDELALEVEPVIPWQIDVYRGSTLESTEDLAGKEQQLDEIAAALRRLLGLD